MGTGECPPLWAFTFASDAGPPAAAARINHARARWHYAAPNPQSQCVGVPQGVEG